MTLRVSREKTIPSLSDWDYARIHWSHENKYTFTVIQRNVGIRSMISQTRIAKKMLLSSLES